MTQFHKIHLEDRPYQQITIAQGSAPIAFVKSTVDGGFDMVYIGESILQAPTTECGAYLIKTGEDIDPQVHILPWQHSLTGQPFPPDARYIGTVGDTHLVLGNPKVESSRLIM
jgi:hypothetical protein